MTPRWLPRWSHAPVSTAGEESREAGGDEASGVARAHASGVARNQVPDAARIRVVSRAGCHLCDEALAVVEQVAGARGEDVDVLDVDADPTLRARFGDLVPVVFVDDRQVATFRIGVEELERALVGGR